MAGLIGGGGPRAGGPAREPGGRSPTLAPVSPPPPRCGAGRLPKRSAASWRPSRARATRPSWWAAACATSASAGRWRTGTSRPPRPPRPCSRSFPRAIPIGLRHGTVMVPSAAGPIDVTHLPGPGPRRRSRAARLHGERDGAASRRRRRAGSTPRAGSRTCGRAGCAPCARRASGCARIRCARCARCASSSQLGFALDPELAGAVREAAPALARVAARAHPAELERLLLARASWAAPSRCSASWVSSRARRAADRRRRAGASSPPCPPTSTLRLAAWLRGRDAAALLGRLRFPRQRTGRGRAARAAPPDRREPRGAASSGACSSASGAAASWRCSRSARRSSRPDASPRGDERRHASASPSCAATSSCLERAGVLRGRAPAPRGRRRGGDGLARLSRRAPRSGARCAT